MTITAEPPTVIGPDDVDPDDHTTTHQDPDSAVTATDLPPVQAEDAVADAAGGSEQDGAAADPDDGDELFAAMMRLAQPDEASELGRLATQRSSAFTWETVAGKLVAALDGP